MTDVIRKIVSRLQYKNSIFSYGLYLRLDIGILQLYYEMGCAYNVTDLKSLKSIICTSQIASVSTYCPLYGHAPFSLLFRSLGFYKEPVFSFKSCYDMPLSMFHLLF